VTGVPDDRLRAALADRYRIERELGRGGMATVYLAHDRKHERLVALKVLDAEHASTVGPERFQREIRLAARLQHPHILPVFDSGETETGQLWFTMPYVDGEALRDRLRREGQLPLDEALRIAGETAQALQYAHEQGVIHRDIKPENLLLTRDGNTLVADFGVARALGAGEALTQVGVAVGTPAYMSPEQASGEKLDARTDVYSLGCVLYEMLAGEPPFTGPNTQAIIAKRFATTPTRIRVVRPEVPQGIDDALARALARAPADRFASAAELRQALRSGTTPSGTGTFAAPAPLRPIISRRAAALLGGAAVLVAVMLVAFWLRPRAAAPAMTSQHLTYTGKAMMPALSPDGQSVAYISGTRSLVVQRLDGSDPVVLVPPVRFAAWPRWSQDGRTILLVMFRDSLTLAATWAVPSTGGTARKVLDDQLAFDADPGSTLLVRVPRERHRIEVLDWTTGRVVQTIPLPAEADDGFASVEWSPDHRWFAVAAFGAVWTVPATGGPAARLLTGANPRWSAGSDAVYVLGSHHGSEAVYRVSVDPASGAARGAPTLVASLPGLKEFDVRGHRLIYSIAATGQQARALVFGAPGTGQSPATDRVVSQGTAPVTNVALSADGRTIAFSQQRGDDQNIYVVPFDSGAARAVAASPAQESAPAVSPDGSRIAFVRQDSASTALMVADIASGSAQRVGSLPISGRNPVLVSVNRPRWSADGQHIAYPAQDQRHVALVDLAHGTEQDFTIPDSVGSAYGEVVPSPNGDALVASTLRRMTDWGEVWTSADERGPWRRASTPFGENHPIAWHADGWVYLENHRGIGTDYGALQLELWRTRGPAGAPVFVARLPEGCMQADVAADGRRVVCVSIRTESDLYVGTGFDPDEGRR
jgi:eukaryotic-like serine/threonine-protein kinase